MSAQGDGGPAFPRSPHTGEPSDYGMSLRDWFAGTMQEDDRLVKCIRAMDDRNLELFALHPTVEREEHITETQWIGMDEVEKIATRLELEARCIAKVRYMQADAMLSARKEKT